MAMLQVKDLKKVFRTEEIETIALNGVSFEVNKGEFVAIMGPSGCGKSTLLNILGLLDNPTSGSYRLLDKEVSTLKEKDRTKFRKGNIGFVFQTFQLLPKQTALENVCLPAMNPLAAGRQAADAAPGKKVKKQEAAEKVAAGKFAPRGGPKLAVNNG